MGPKSVCSAKGEKYHPTFNMWWKSFRPEITEDFSEVSNLLIKVRSELGKGLGEVQKMV